MDEIVRRADDRHIPLAAQGHTSAAVKVEVAGQNYVVKSANRKGLGGWLTRRVLQREYRIYQRLLGVTGTPKCVGCSDEYQLVLEYIDGQPFTQSVPVRDSFFDELREIIEAIHDRGVAHGDLKTRGNILIDAQGAPVLVDFGVSIVKRSAFHPLNRFMFRLACDLDMNAYLKHRYGKHTGNKMPANTAPYRRTGVEAASHFFREASKWIIRGIRNF